MAVIKKIIHIICQVNRAKRPSAAMPPRVPPTIAAVLFPGAGVLAWFVCKGSVVSPERVEEAEVEVADKPASEDKLTGTVDETEV